MGTESKSIRLRPDEDNLLRQRYVARRIPVDQYEKRPEDLAAFVEEWNRLSERNDSPGEVLRYMRSKRKDGKWPKFNGEHERSPAIRDDVLSEDQWTHLEATYVEICIARNLGSDAISHDDDLAKEVSDDFARRTRLILPGRYLLTLLMQRRKRKRLPRVRDNRPKPDLRFGDIDDVNEIVS